MDERSALQPVASAYPQFYPPIGDYAVIGDCRTAALIARDGGLDWLCLPHFSGPALFAALLDRGRGGHFSIHPKSYLHSSRRYVDDTAVLETTFHGEGGVLRLTDMMTVVGETPDAIEPQREVLRLVEVVEGSVEIEISYAPRPDFGRSPPQFSRRGALGWALKHESQLAWLHSDVDLRPDAAGKTLTANERLSAGERRWFSLGYVERDVGVILPLGREAERRMETTVRWWRAWAGRCRPVTPHSSMVVRSAVTLKLLTYSLSGAVVAAPTASLPETIGGSRNWDYRFCWLRDASLTLEALLDLGYVAEGEAFLGWLLHATRLTWPRLQVLYDVYGAARIPEQILDHLDGYRGSRPVRIGNGAWNQLQLDAYGGVVVAAAAYVGRGGKLNQGEKRLLVGLGRSVCRLWRWPDQGIWEMRGPPRHHTHSKVLCWAALNCLLFLAEQGALAVPEDEFRGEREAIRTWIEGHAYVPGLGYVADPETRHADAATLLLPYYRYVDGRDPRMAETLAHVERVLGRNGLVLRYPPESDDLAGVESPFGICSFWAVEALVHLGRVDEAEERFDHLMGFANDVGLFAEEIDALTGEAIGNFPQAFTHVGLMKAALAIDAARGGSSR